MQLLPPEESRQYLEFAHKLADLARTITLKHFRTPLDITSKTDQSPVTIADRDTETALRSLISQTYPEHAILGEEHGQTGSSRYQWILDPIDGTRSYISGFPIYSTLIALLIDGHCVLSIIDMPALDERYSAADHIPAELNGRPITASRLEDLGQAICYSTDPAMFSPQQMQKHQRVQQHIRQQRWTGDGYIYAMLSAGWIHLAIETDMKPHDYLPLIRLIEQAGGIITDWQGQSLTENSSGEILAAANPSLHRQALALLNSQPSP